MFYHIALGILFVAVVTSHGERRKTAKNETCEQQECTKLVNEISGQRGMCEPCNNFYDYVCGNWNGSTELKSKHLKPKAVQDLIDLLERASTPTTQTPNATDKLLLAYKSCTKKGQDKEALRASVINVLNHYNLGQWPIISQETKENKSYRDILENTGPLPVFRCVVSEENKSAPIIVMTKPVEFYVSDDDFIGFAPSLDSRDDDKNSNDEYYAHYDDTSEDDYKTFIKDTISLLNETLTDEQKLKVAEEIITLEKALSKLASKAQKNRTVMTLADLNNLFGNSISMERILQKDFGNITETINSTTQVEVEYASYYEEAVKLMKNANTTTHLENYISWTKIRNMAMAEATPLHQIYLEYKNKTFSTGLDDQDRISDEKLRCMNQLLQYNVMYSVGAHYYSTVKFDRNAKDEVTKMLGFINSTFRNVVMRNTWMSDSIKTKAMKQLDEMTFVIGYPDWILESSTINSLYKFVPSIKAENSFVQHFYWLQENERLQKLLKITSAYFDKTNEDVTLRSHAFYKPKTNTLGYPAASLATHYRKPPIARSMNFGTIGTVLAGLYAYAVDRFHGFTKEQKITTDFWDEETKNNFCDRSQCLNNTEECNDTTKRQSSRYQHLDDYLGVRVSHEALVRSKVNYSGPLLLPGEDFNSEDKIFLTAFGSLYCPYRVNENQQKVQSRSDEGEEAKFPKRLNEVVSIYKLFNETFNCSGTFSDTCNLMPVKGGSGADQC